MTGANGVLGGDARRERRVVVAASFALCVLGGAVAVALLFAVWPIVAVAIGLAVSLAPGAVLAAQPHRRRVGSALLTWSFGFALLIWPALAVLAGVVWGFGD